MTLIKVKSRGTDNVSGRRNIAINGAMQVAQRATSKTDISTSGYHTVDRFRMATNSAGRSTMTQETITDLPGFANAIKLDCTTADTSLGSGEYLQLSQFFEGQDLQSFKKGTSSAEKVTVSFYVKGNGNATYVCELFDGDNTRHINQQFSVTSSWNRVSLTFNGDTTGAFDDDNDLSLYLNLWLAAGSGYSGGTYTANTWAANVNANRAVGGSNFYSSTDNTFFITGFQVEVGDSASDFEHRSFGEELSLCQRYFQLWGAVQPVGAGTWYSASQIIAFMPFHKIMRSAPTMTTSGSTFAKVYLGGSTTKPVDDSSPFDLTKRTSTRMNLTVSSNGTSGHGAMVQTQSGAYIHADAEL